MSRKRDLENMSIQALTEELNRIEQEVGKEQFERLLDDVMTSLEGTLGGESVTAHEWMQTHPANLVCGSDTYYAALATDLCGIIAGYNIQIEDTAAVAIELGRVLAAYLEDIVSGTRVFSAMRRICMERYGYKLPFYDCEHEDYMPDHINEEDIRFLIWKTVCQQGKEYDKTYSPLFSPGWAMVADRIFDELNARYEEAPEAMRLADWLRRAFRKGDYIDIREIASWLFFRNPMTYYPGLLDSFREGMAELGAEMDQNPEMTFQLLYSVIANQSWQRSMSPMGCTSQSLVAAMALEFGFDEIAGEIADLTVRPHQIYAITQEKKTRRLIFEASNHEKLLVERDSLAKGFKASMTDYAECTLVKFQGKYLLNGALMSGHDDMKKAWEEQLIMPSDDVNRENAEKWIEALEGKQVACITNLKPLYKKLNFPEPDINDFPEAKNYVVLISREMGITLLPDMGYAFNIPGNRFFRKREAVSRSFGQLVFRNAIPHDLALYLQEHDLLPEAHINVSQGKEVGHRIVQDYLAFWIGFYRHLPAYDTVPKQQ